MGIDSEDGRHGGQMVDGQLTATDSDRVSGVAPCERPSQPDPSSPLAAARIRHLVDAHFDFVWRSLRRMGLSDADSDDYGNFFQWVLARPFTENISGLLRLTAYRARDAGPHGWSGGRAVARAWSTSITNNPFIHEYYTPYVKIFELVLDQFFEPPKR